MKAAGRVASAERSESIRDGEAAEEARRPRRRRLPTERTDYTEEGRSEFRAEGIEQKRTSRGTERKKE